MRAVCRHCSGGIYFAAGHWFHLVTPWDVPHAPEPPDDPAALAAPRESEARHLYGHSPRECPACHRDRAPSGLV